jgi:signal transduction histidine kinase
MPAIDMRLLCVICQFSPWPVFSVVWEDYRFWGLAVLALVAGSCALHLHRRRQLQGEGQSQSNLARQLLEQLEAERKRVAHAVHDGLGHQLLELKSAAAQARRDHPAVDAVLHAQLETISALASESLETARGIAYRLRPFELDQLGLQAAIEALVRDLCQGTDLRVFQDLKALPGNGNSAQRLHLFRLVQEALVNAIRHAHATTLLIETRREGDHVVIQVEDDGTGFDVAAARWGPNRGLGLARMDVHARALGGELGLWSAPGRGTRVRLTVPTTQCQPP